MRALYQCRATYEPLSNYGKWRERTRELANLEETQFVVSCDIAAFYDRINIHRIESTLESINVDASLIKQINELLLFWSQKDSYGLPVGNVASRILAEAALIDIDQYLLDENILFTRYVDDFRLFAPDILTAQKWMNKLNSRLFRDGLLLNTRKTRLSAARTDPADTDPETDTDGHTQGDNRRNTQDNRAENADQAEEILTTITRLTGGYNRIARRFVMPAEDKHDAFKAVDISDELATLEKESIVEFEGIQKLVIACLIQKDFYSLIQVAELCSRYLYALDYFVDMLIKNKKYIPKKKKTEVADYFERLTRQSEFESFDWHQATIAHLLSDPDFFRKTALMEIVRSPTKDRSTYPAIVALEGLEERLTRSDFRTLREWFERSDDWERRRLLRLSKALPSEERKAWAKAVKPSVKGDFLGYQYADTISRGQEI